MASAKITILGFENWLQAGNKSLFDKLVLPAGYVKEDVVNDILLTAGEFEALYADPEFLTEAIGLWGKRYYRTFDKWLKALNIEYNPLENYDRIEEFTDDNSSIGTTQTDTSGNSQANVSAYDANTMQPSSSDSNSQTATGTAEGSTHSTHNGRTHGNIGVTTSQQMLQSELDVAMFSLYKKISKLFVQELCLAVYD